MINAGLRYVYTGNIHDPAGQSTYCHSCGCVLIGRDWYDITAWHLSDDGCCAECGMRCHGVFEKMAGRWDLLAGKYETAAALLRQRIILIPKTDFSRALLTSVLGHLGEVEDARRVWAELIEINPNYSFTGHVGRQPFKRQEDVERIAEGLVKAGLLNEQIVTLAH